MINILYNKKIKLYTENNHLDKYNNIIIKFSNYPYGSIKYNLSVHNNIPSNQNLKLDTYEEKEIHKEFKDFCNAQKLFKIYLDLLMQISTTKQDYNKLSTEEKEQLEITHDLAKYINQSLQLKRYNDNGKLNAHYIRNTLYLSLALSKASIKYDSFLSQCHLDNAIKSCNDIKNNIKSRQW